MIDKMINPLPLLPSKRSTTPNRPSASSPSTPTIVVGHPPRGAARWEHRFAVALLLYAMGAGVRVLRPIDPAAQGDTVLQLVWLGVYAVAAYGLLKSRHGGRVPVRIDPVLIALIALSFASFTWSFDTTLTLRRSFALAGTGICGLFLAVRFSAREQLRILWWATIVVLLASLVDLLVAPSDAVHPVDGLRGILFHKNQLGIVMALGLLGSLLSCRYFPTQKLRFAISAAGMLVMLLGTQSRTSLLAAAFVIMIVVVASLHSSRRHTGILSLTFFALAATVAFHWLGGGAEAILDGLGRDRTLTGRTELWGYVTQAVLERPVVGHGYGAFWQGADDAVRQIRSHSGFSAPHAHFGLLDVALQLGLVGVALTTVLFARNLKMGFKDIAANKTRAESLMRVGILSFIFVINLAESNLVVPNSLSMLLLFIAVAKIWTSESSDRAVAA